MQNISLKDLFVLGSISFFFMLGVNAWAMCSREVEDDCFSVGRPKKNRREVMFPTTAAIAYEPLLN